MLSFGFFVSLTVHCNFLFFFFFNDTATTEIYTLSLHDALPIFCRRARRARLGAVDRGAAAAEYARRGRSEEHTSELQSQSNLVCRLLLEKKKKGKVEVSSCRWSVGVAYAVRE